MTADVIASEQPAKTDRSLRISRAAIATYGATQRRNPGASSSRRRQHSYSQSQKKREEKVGFTNITRPSRQTALSEQPCTQMATSHGKKTAKRIVGSAVARAEVSEHPSAGTYIASIRGTGAP